MKKKSLFLVVTCSILLPGGGLLYTGSTTIGIILIITSMLTLVGLLGFWGLFALPSGIFNPLYLPLYLYGLILSIGRAKRINLLERSPEEIAWHTERYGGEYPTVGIYQYPFLIELTGLINWTVISYLTFYCFGAEKYIFSIILAITLILYGGIFVAPVRVRKAMGHNIFWGFFASAIFFFATKQIFIGILSLLIVGGLLDFESKFQRISQISGWSALVISELLFLLTCNGFLLHSLFFYRCFGTITKSNYW